MAQWAQWDSMINYDNPLAVPLDNNDMSQEIGTREKS